MVRSSALMRFCIGLYQFCIAIDTHENLTIIRAEHYRINNLYFTEI